MRARAIPLAVAALVACADPSDVLYTPVPAPPVEARPGVFQLTFGPDPDVVRGFTPTGDTILFLGRRADATGLHNEVLSISTAGGAAVERAAIYRRVLRQAVGGLTQRPEDRFLSLWRPGNDAGSAGPAGCPTLRVLPVFQAFILRLPVTDGAPLSDIPGARTVSTNTSSPAVLGAATYRVRFLPAEADAERGANALGPVAAPGAAEGFYSDGETLWRFSIADSVGADSVGQGLYPAVSPDGSLFAAATPIGLDSTSVTQFVPLGLLGCTQITWSYTAQSWLTTVRRTATGDTVMQVSGTEPNFDPVSGRILVSRAAGLVWVDLATKAESAIPNTTGAFAVAISPSGNYAAFSLIVSNNADVYFVKLK